MQIYLHLTTVRDNGRSATVIPQEKTMAKKNYYAVWKGLTPGIYDNWPQAQAQVSGFTGAGYKGTATFEEASALMEENGVTDYFVCDVKTAGEPVQMTLDLGTPGEPVQMTPDTVYNEPYAFTDGSYNMATGVFGYGGFLINDGIKYKLQGSSDDPELAASWNVAGETVGAMAAIEKAKELGIKELTIYYDYEGVEKWATGAWKTNKPVSVRYKEYIEGCGIKIDFVHVKAHTGIPGNEEADRLAKEAAGVL